MKAVVIGTGFESLASALRLRALGHDVDVLEADSSPGGWARSFHISGHIVDGAPPTISSPWLFDELFALFKERRADFVEFLPSQLYRRNVYPDGSTLDIVSTVEGQEAEIASVSPDDARRYRAFLRRCESKTPRHPRKAGKQDGIDFMTTLQNSPLPTSVKTFSNLWRATGRYFTDRRVRQAFSWPALAAGLNPLVAPAHRVSLHAAEREGGMWLVRGGLSTLTRELVALGERHGVRFHYDHAVVSLVRDGAGMVSSVFTAHGGERAVMHCDLVVWGGASRSVYSTIQREALSPLERIGLRPTQPAFGMYALFIQTKRSYPEVADQTVVFSDRWEGLLSQIAKGPHLPKDPMFAVYRLPPIHSPASHREEELFSVVVPVPHLGRYTGWKFDGTVFKDRVLTKVRERVLPGLSSHLVFAESIDPRYARDVLNHPFGAPFPPGPVASQSYGGNFEHRLRRIQNLFVCGGGLGGASGIAGAMTSARLVVEHVAMDFPAARPYERLADTTARSVA